MGVCDSYFALAAFVLLPIVVVLGYLLTIVIRENEKLRDLIRPFDANSDGRPGGSRKRHDPYIDR